MSTPYTVQSGDYLQKIAEEHGFESWRDLYYHEDNADFRRRRPNPDRIYPGDIVMIPDREAPVPPPEPPPTPPPTPADRTVVAQAGDTLCFIAVDNGFADCQPLRDHPPNAAIANRQLREGDVVHIPERHEGHEEGETEAEHEFVRRGTPFAQIRFVHGSQTRPFADDPTLRELNISNYVTDQAGTNGLGNVAWVDHNHRTFDANAHADEDTFKVEVLDTRTRNHELDVTIEPRRPTYNAGVLDNHTDFPGDPNNAATERGKRRLATRVGRMNNSSGGATNRFRSCYLRLVADEIDRAARAQQTVLVTDLVAGGDAQVEILDQDIRAEYILQTCPAATPAARCRVSTDAPLRRGGRVDLAVRVLRNTPTGVVEANPGGAGDNGVVTLANIRDRINTFTRQQWSQAHVKYRIRRLETVDLPGNMISVGDATGNLSHGTRAGSANPGQIGFTVQVQRFGGAANSTHVVAPFNVPAGNTPQATARLIEAAIDALPNLRADVSVNPPEVGDTRGSADVLIRESGGGRVTITNLTADANQDRSQKVVVSNLTLNLTRRNGFNDYHVGHPEQRNLYKMLDTGDNVIDLHVLNSIPGLLGLTVCEQAHLNANRRPMPGFKNTIVLDKDGADGTTNNPYVVAHEIGHILFDDGLHADSNRELMMGGFLGPPAGTARAVTNPKRIPNVAPTATNWEQMAQNANGTLRSQRVRFNPVQRVHDTSGDLIT